jgi:hypothetical protein
MDIEDEYQSVVRLKLELEPRPDVVLSDKTNHSENDMSSSCGFLGAEN